MGRPEGSMNRRTKLWGGRLLDVARTYTQEALRSIVRIARGEIQGSDGYPVLHPRGNHGKRRLPKDTSRMNAFEREVEERVQKEIAKLQFIPFKVRLAAWIEVLNRGHGKPFKSSMTS